MTASVLTAHDSRWRRPVVLLSAVLVDAVVWGAAVLLLDVDVRVPDGPGATTTSPLELPAVLVSVAVVGLLGWGLLAVLERWLPRRAATVWRWVAVAVVIVSLGAPLFGIGLSAANRVTLLLLHLAVGALLVAALPRPEPPRA